jgi:hypothetical protein
MSVTIAAGAAAGLIVFRHRSNLRRLWKGREVRVGRFRRVGDGRDSLIGVSGE